ncbi:MAG TPA: condensation domain-containing protein, partial [Longimicrobiaceae bacterium]|nr:condensation domain-containing protein [Longimicrobiaceae bacterium]
VPLPRDGEPLPVSFAQQRLWLVHQLEPESPAYNMAVALRLRGRLDAGVLRRSLDALVRRHESLRTVFAVRGGQPVQVVREAGAAALRVADLRGLPRSAREEAAADLALRESLRPFDLAEGPLFRTTLLRLDEEEWGLLVGLHHVVSDGWSMGVLVAELSEVYDALTAGRGPELAELPVQYADYAVWQREHLSGETLERQLAWWADRLRGAPPLLELPTDRPRTPLQDPRGASRAFRLPAATSREVRELARREGATLFMALLAAWQTVLARWSGQEDVSVGTPVAGRTRAELEGLIGFFVNTLVLRADLSGDPGFRTLLGRVRDATLGAFAHQEVPFERLVEELAPERSLTHAPLFQTMFALQNLDGGELRLGALEMEPLAPAGEVAKFDLELQVAEDGEALAGTLVFRTALFDAATAERMLDHFQVLLAGIAADPDACVRELPLASEAELRTLAAWGAAREDLLADSTVLEQFEAQAARAPGAVAVRSGAASLTYAELDARAERIAAELQLRGV